MSKKANKTLIGAFVVGAIALIVAGVIIFGSGKLFAPLKKFVMVFEGSVKGLDVGAPVIFRGVKVGEVTDIRLDVNTKDLTAIIPVYVDIDPRTFAVDKEHKSLIREKKYLYIQPLIEKGLKAQLQMQSFVTGQMMVNLDFYPDRPIKLAGLDTKYPEIPTTATSMQKLTKTIENLDLEGLVEKIKGLVGGIDKLVNSPEMTGSIASLHRTLNAADRLVVNLDGRIGPLADDLQNTLAGARGTLASIEKSFSMEDGIPARIGETMKNADKALKRAEATLAAIQTTSRDASNVGYELSRTLRELAEASRSIRFLADYVERHPEALLRGKTVSEGE